MKISHFLFPVTKGGGEVLISNLIIIQKNQGNNLNLVLGAKNKYLKNILDKYEIKCDQFPFFQSEYSYSLFKTLFRAIIIYCWLSIYYSIKRFDIVHTHSFPAQYLLLPKVLNLFRKRKTKYVHTKHIIGKINLFNKLIWNFALLNNDYLTFLGKSMYENLINFNFEKIKVIGNPANNEFFEVGNKKYKKIFSDNDIDGKESSNKEVLSCCVISRLVKGKGHLELIDFISRFLSINPSFNIQFKIVGDGEFNEKITNSIKDKNLNNIIKMKGFLNQNEILDIIDSADFAIHPSMNEGQSISCLQYLASCLPTMCKKIDSAIEIFSSKSSFYDDYDSFAIGLKKLFKKEERLRLSKIYYKEREKARFSVISDLYDQLYKT